MERIGILCGFDIPKFREFNQLLKKKLTEYGIEASFDVRLHKQSIKEYVDANVHCKVVILTERIGREEFTAQEIALLTDKRDVNVIVVLNTKGKDKEFLKVLYNANITNAILQDGRSGGASVSDVAQLIVKKRSRMEARKVYGITDGKLEFGFLNDEAYLECYRKLHKDSDLMKNYIDCCGVLSPQQIADFTRRLPKDDMDELVKFQEFHVVMQLLKKFGFDLKIKKPKKCKIGLVTPKEIHFLGMEDICLERETDLEEGKQNMRENQNSFIEPESLSIAQMLNALRFSPSLEESECAEENPGSSISLDKEKGHQNMKPKERVTSLNEATNEVLKESTDNGDSSKELQTKLELQEAKIRKEYQELLVNSKKEQEKKDKAYEREIRDLKKREERLKRSLETKQTACEEEEFFFVEEKPFSRGFFLILMALVLAAVILFGFSPSYINLGL